MKPETGLRSRMAKNRLFFAGIIALCVVAVTPLVFILAYVVIRGASSVNWTFLTALPVPVGESGGGIANAVLGTGIVVGIAALISIPLGVVAGVFLSEKSSAEALKRGGKGAARLGVLTRFSIETLMGVPSIVIGIVAYVWVVKPMGHFSALSGGIALSMIMLPVIALTTEETLRLVPASLKEAALALGVPYRRVIAKVVIPAGSSGIVTGTLLAVARGAGETAPLLFTAFGSPFLSANVLQPMASLPLTIFTYATSPYPHWHDLAWGASFVLLIFILALNLITKLVTSRWKIRF
jgi:phosphate transport system permease protein